MSKLAIFFTVTFPAKVKALWASLPPRTQQWLKGAEAAVVTAVVASFVAAPASNLTTKKGVLEFVAGVGSAAYGALRLYMAQQPITNALVKKTSTETVTVGDVSSTTSTSTETVQSAAPVSSPNANNPHK